MDKTIDTVSSVSFGMIAKVKDYFQLMKFTLSFTVVFSCVICYLLAPKVVHYDLGMIVLLFIAGMLVSGRLGRRWGSGCAHRCGIRFGRADVRFGRAGVSLRRAGI